MESFRERRLKKALPRGFALVTIGASFFLLWPSVSQAGITGSAHDFTSYGWSAGRPCIVCHTPHDSDTSPAYSPLWNHALTGQTYTLYPSSELEGAIDQPVGVSRLCLSCHDGTVAIDSYGGATGSQYISGDALIGTDLSNDHPIAVDWTHPQPYPSCSNCHGHGGGGWDSQLPFYSTDGRRNCGTSCNLVECASCHNVHNESGNLKLLRLPKSDLCQHCHGQ
jgi:predicted CXXCH cytochrome family protein